MIDKYFQSASVTVYTLTLYTLSSPLTNTELVSCRSDWQLHQLELRGHG